MAARRRTQYRRETPPRSNRSADTHDVGECTGLEPEGGIDPMCGLVLERQMQERLLVSRPYLLDDRAYEARGDASPAVRFVGANRADLGEPRWVQALTGHRDEIVSVTKADVGPELDRSRCERARLGALHQREHVRHIARSERPKTVVAGAQPVCRLGRERVEEPHLPAGNADFDGPT